MSANPMVIVGAGLAGATAADALRAEGYSGGILLIGQEPHYPYLRPPLSKDYLTGSSEVESTLVYDAGWYDSRGIDLNLDDTAAAVHPELRCVELSGGSLNYDRLLLATGASPRHLDIPGAGLQGIHYLRTLEQSTLLREALSGGDRTVVIVGSGWIGMEVAAAARGYGNQVTVLGLENIPLSIVLGDRLGEVFADLHRDHGVRFIMPASAAEFRGSDGQVSGVLTDGGQMLPADLVVVSIGVVPNVRLAQEAGLTVRNGIEVDDAMRSSDPYIFAAGDVANAYHPVLGAHLRSEHWANAIAGGKAAAKAMLGQDVHRDDIPYFYTDQYDLGMEYSGYGPLAAKAELVIRGDLNKREFIAFWVLEGRVVAGMNVNVWDVQEEIKELISSGETIDPDALADTTRELNQI